MHICYLCCFLHILGAISLLSSLFLKLALSSSRSTFFNRLLVSRVYSWDVWCQTCALPGISLCLCYSTPHPASPLLKTDDIIASQYFSALNHCVIVISISFYINNYLSVQNYGGTKGNKSKTDQPQTPGQLEKVLLQLNQVKQSCRQVSKVLEGADLEGLCCKDLQIQCKANCLCLGLAHHTARLFGYNLVLWQVNMERHGQIHYFQRHWC